MKQCKVNIFFAKVMCICIKINKDVGNCNNDIAVCMDFYALWPISNAALEGLTEHHSTTLLVNAWRNAWCGFSQISLSNVWL